MIGVILCGGAGSRLWPMSRELHPKPFLRLGDGQSFLQKALLRAKAVSDSGKIITVTNEHLRFMVMEEYRSAGLLTPATHILEPFGRNTAPAVAAAALEARNSHGEDECLMVFAADHLIRDNDAFLRAAERARELAMKGSLVVFGIAPLYPETGYGYVEAEGDRVIRFVEKPDADTARRYVDSGRFFWNSGMFCFRVGVVLEELRRHAPELLAAMESCLAGSTVRAEVNMADTNHLYLEPEMFAGVPDISIDYALMEKSDRIAMVACDAGWSDVGSWDAWNGLMEADAAGNRVSETGNARILDSRNCDITNPGRLVAALGVDNLLIVDTPDALLVADKARAADVKRIYGDLKAEGHSAYKHHNQVYRPWGSYTSVEMGPDFQIKRLALNPGASISLQLHHHRNEHWIIVNGEAEITCDGEVFTLGRNDSTYIRAGQKHRIANRGNVELVLIEVQLGSYLGEDDIVRFEDMYERI